MSFKLFLLIISLSFSLSSPPTNCKVCYGHFKIFSELKTNEEKIKSIEKFYSYFMKNGLILFLSNME